MYFRQEAAIAEIPQILYTYLSFTHMKISTHRFNRPTLYEKYGENATLCPSFKVGIPGLLAVVVCL